MPMSAVAMVAKTVMPAALRGARGAAGITLVSLARAIAV